MVELRLGPTCKTHLADVRITQFVSNRGGAQLRPPA